MCGILPMRRDWKTYIYIYPTSPHEQDAIQDQLFYAKLGFNLESSFSYTGCFTKVKELSLPYYLLWKENSWMHTFPKDISAIWNANINSMQTLVAF